MTNNFTDTSVSLFTAGTGRGTGTALDLVIQMAGDYLIFVVSTPLATFGCFANILSLIIFIKQGRRDCVTVCLFALGTSDFLCCFTVLIFSSIYASNHVNRFSVMEPLALDVVLSYISALFYDISQGITAFIALQRCLCVAMPLKFKNMFTINRSVAIMLAFFILTTVAYTPHFRTCGLYLKFDAVTNVTVMSLWQSSDRGESIFWLNYLLHIGVDTFYLLVVVVSAFVMISGLKKSSIFRQQESRAATVHYRQSVKEDGLSNHTRRESNKDPHTVDRGKDATSNARPLSDKNRNVVRTIFALSLVAIICNTERLGVVYGQRFVPGLTFDGVYRNVFFVSARVTFLFGMVNSSLNVFIYYFFNPSYRRTFVAIFTCRRQTEDKTEK